MRKLYLTLILTLLALTLGLTACAQQDQVPAQNEPEASTPAAKTDVETETQAPAEDAGSATGPEIELVSLETMSVRKDGMFRIVTTTTQANDLAQILTEGVDGIEITPLMGAGVDPHLYQPTESDIAAMNAADMVIYSGLHLEGQFDAVFAALNEQGVLIYTLSKPVKDAGFVIGAFDAELAQLGTDDPHFWFDPRNWEITTADLAETLAVLDPDNAEVYQTNGKAYVTQLRDLYAWADEGMKSVPGGQRYLVTSHDAFQYFGAAFGWRMAAIQGVSTEDEAGVGDIQGTIDFVINNNIPVLFVESSIPPGTVEAVQEAIEADGGHVRVGVRELYSDAMAEPDTFGGTYTGMIAENVYTILQSYQCAGAEVTIPEWPDSVTPAPSTELLNVNCR
jgi:manganese/zinc/iron transport system substrate-binding protein